jgi:hypothetical protein
VAEGIGAAMIAPTFQQGSSVIITVRGVIVGSAVSASPCQAAVNRTGRVLSHPSRSQSEQFAAPENLTVKRRFGNGCTATGRISLNGCGPGQ